MTPAKDSPTADQTDLGSLQREQIISVLRQNGGNEARSARSLGVSRRTLYRLLDKHGIALDKTVSELASVD